MTIMADIRIRKRKRLRNKEVKALSEELESVLGVPVFSDSEPVDRAESTDMDLIIVSNDILCFIIGEKPFLTVRGVLKYKPVRRFVTVDMGAVPFITNGADCMGPGIVDADRQPILTRSEMYSGVKGRASINLYAYNVNGNRGVACGLNNLQKIADGRPLGGKSRAEDDFATEEDEDFLD
jgi:hypothetical protein